MTTPLPNTTAPARVVHLPKLDFGSWYPAWPSPAARCESVQVSQLALPGDVTGPVQGHWPIATDIALELKGTFEAGGTLEVCIVPPRCCAREEQVAAVVTVTTQQRPGGDVALEIPLEGRVLPTSWLRCHAAELTAAVTTLLVIFAVVGWMWPRRFSANDRIKLSGTERGLVAASARQLRSQPGGRGGFYRHATACFDSSGGAVRNPKRALLVLRAGKRGVELEVRGHLERQDSRTKKWEPIPAPQLRSVLSPHRIFRAGDLYFSVA